MAEFGNAVSMPCIGMTTEVDPEVRANAELSLAFNYALAQQEYPELLGHSYSVIDGPVIEVFEEYGEDPETGDTYGMGPIVGFTKAIGWHVNTGSFDAAE